MGMKPNNLEDFLYQTLPKSLLQLIQALTINHHMLNWLECVRTREKTNAPVDPGYNHSINIMTTASMRTGLVAQMKIIKK